MQSLTSAANVSFLGVVALAFSRPEMGALNLGLACFYLVQAWYVGRFEANLATLTASLCVSLLVQVAGHVIMGGYFYSGGYLLFGIVIVVNAAVAGSRPVLLGITSIYLVAALVLAFAEPALQEAREAPAVALPTIFIVDVFVVSVVIVGPLILALVERVVDQQARNRELMLNILPEAIADRLKTQPGMIADRHEGCTIVFADLVGFTAHSKGKDPAHLVGELNTIFTRFDALAAQHGAEKIKTIGDGYMAATGLPDSDPDHIAHACDLALAMVDAMPALNAQLGTDFQLRVGVNAGSAVAGVVGTSKFSYDVWGDTVNLASRLESNGVPGIVVVSAGVAAAMGGHYDVQALGVRDLKGQGPTEIYRLARTRSALV